MSETIDRIRTTQSNLNGLIDNLIDDAEGLIDDNEDKRQQILDLQAENKRQAERIVELEQQQGAPADE